mmetsp:Transcript_26286/g.39812  ORF Transcript_26286/g.39812 Transcript_26286/m.39812 type:complete len:947 (-) Transcript_26286:161-3001(-)
MDEHDDSPTRSKSTTKTQRRQLESKIPSNTTTAQEQIEAMEYYKFTRPKSYKAARNTTTTTTAGIRSPSFQQMTKANNNNNNNNNRQRRNNKKNNTNATTVTSKEKNGNEKNDSPTTSTTTTKNNHSKKKKKGQPNIKDNADSAAASTTNNNYTNANNKKKKKNNDNSQQQQNNNNNDTTNKKKTARRKKKNNKKKYPWKALLPEGSVDPITLELLHSLPYPPFALCADAPYTVVSDWPVVKPVIGEEKKEDDKETVEERQKKVLESQWGSVVATVATTTNHDDKKDDTTTNSIIPLHERKFNLYDGRALAYYMVSQLQFIDPLNRRDLTRDEIVNLDLYLRKHSTSRSDHLNVTQAYDDKGITVSSASAMASTQAGQLELRQQTAQALAQSLLQSLFAGGISTTTNTSSSSNALQQQYAATQRREAEERRRRRTNQHQYEDDNDVGIYEQDGFAIIDDDANPGLRGTSRYRQNNNGMTAEAPSFTPGNLWSASHITNRYVSHDASQHASNFPALHETIATTAAPAPTNNEATASRTSNNHNKKQSKPTSKSLSRITKVIAKTDPKQVQKQIEARELFVKRAAMSNLSFGSSADPSSASTAITGLLSAAENTTTTTTQQQFVPTEGQLNRNQTLASALGVVPATVRQQQVYNQGWARPVDINEFDAEFSANIAVYPDALLQMAREKGYEFIIKVEKKWKTWLQDDTAASLPLSKMDRPTRTLVHHYGDFWKLQTESFDPEPNRYIHCVKLRETAAPYPLLSLVMRQPKVQQQNYHRQQQQQRQQQQVQQQSAGQSPREFPPHPTERIALSLKPRSTASTSTQAQEYRPVTTTSSAAVEPNRRSGELFVGRERPKLDLAPRTLPTELPPMETTSNNNSALVEAKERYAKMQQEERKRKEQQEELKRKVLESAFASDDEEESIRSHDSAEWEGLLESQPAYVSSDDEE